MKNRLRQASAETNESIVAVESKVKQDDTKLEKIEKVQKPDDSKVDVSSGGESDSITKPLPNVSSPKQLVPVASSQEPKEVPVHSPRMTKDVHKPEENENMPIPESSAQHHHQPSNIHLPNVPSHGGVFDPMVLLAHVSSTAQAAATNTVFQNTPPDTPERSPHVLSHGGLSPEQDSSSMRSEGDVGDGIRDTGRPPWSPLATGRRNLPPPVTLVHYLMVVVLVVVVTFQAPKVEQRQHLPVALPSENPQLLKRKTKTRKLISNLLRRKRGVHKRQSHGTAGQSEKSKGSSKSHPHHSSKFFNSHYFMFTLAGKALVALLAQCRVFNFNR